MTQNRDWENYAEQQMMARQAQEVGMSAARQAAYGQAQQIACQQARPDPLSDIIEVTAGELGTIRIDGRLTRQAQYTGRLTIIAEAIAHEAGKLYEEKRVNVPTQEEYTRALFESDPRVVSFVRSVADGILEVSDDGIEIHVDAFRRAMETAYRRDEGGWRTEAWYRAAAMITAINQGRSQRQRPGSEE